MSAGPLQVATRENKAQENNWSKSTVIIAGPSLVTLIPMLAAPAMPLMAERFATDGDGTMFAQLVMTLPAIALILAAPIAGILAEKFGRRAIMLCGLGMFALSGGAALVLDHPSALIASRLLLGAAGGVILTGSLALAGDYPAGGPRERLLGFIVAGSSIMAVVALVGGGYMVARWGWRMPFSLYLLGLPVLLMAAFSLKPHRHPRYETDHLPSPIRTLWPIYLLASMLTVGMFMPSIQGPFLLLRHGINSAGVQSLIIAACSLVAALSAASYGVIGRYLNSPGVLLMTALCFGAGALGMSMAHDGMTIAMASAVMGIGAGLVEATCATLIMARVPLAMRSRALGLLLSAIFFGQFLNPWVVGPLRALFGIDGAFRAIGVLFFLLALAIATGKIVPGRMRIQPQQTQPT